MFQPEQLLGRLSHELVDGVLIAQPIATGDGVIGVLVDGVVCRDHCCSAALCRDRVAAHGIYLGDDRDAEAGVGFRDGNGGTQACSTAPNQHYVIRSGHDRTRNRGLETLLPVNDFVFQDGTAVADHIS